MAKTMPRGMRAATSAVLLVGGGAIAAATWISGDHGFAVAVIVFYVVAAGIAWLWSGGKGDVAAIMRVGGDERQRSLDRDATTIAGYAMVFAAIAGAVVEIARGHGPGAYGVMCVVGGVTYVVSLFVLQRRR
jgi:hypothetical protein